jgi:hypothetical protein
MPNSKAFFMGLPMMPAPPDNVVMKPTLTFSAATGVAAIAKPAATARIRFDIPIAIRLSSQDFWFLEPFPWSRVYRKAAWAESAYTKNLHFPRHPHFESTHETLRAPLMAIKLSGDAGGDRLVCILMPVRGGGGTESLPITK